MQCENATFMQHNWGIFVTIWSFCNLLRALSQHLLGLFAGFGKWYFVACFFFFSIILFIYEQATSQQQGKKHLAS